MLNTDSFLGTADAPSAWHDYFESRDASQAERSEQIEDAYRQIQAERLRIGLARLNMGYNLHVLKVTGGWRGRTGASSFRRFLLEEGLEPKAAAQYMAVARVYLIDHGVDPVRIARVSMRLLVASIPKITASNIEDVVSLLSSLPAAEARCAIEEQFPDVLQEALPADGLAPLPRRVHKVLNDLDGMSFDERRELYRVLHLRASALPEPAPKAAPLQSAVATNPSLKDQHQYRIQGESGKPARPRRSLFASFAATAAALTPESVHADS